MRINKALLHGHTSHATARPRRPLQTPFVRGIGHRDRCALSPLLHPWLGLAISAAASSKQLQPRGERLVYPESKRAAVWVENRSEVVCSTVTVRVVTGVGLSGSKAEGPGSVNVQRVVCCVSRQFRELLPALRKEKTWKASGSSERRQIESRNSATRKKWCARAVTLAEAARASPCSEH